MTSIVLILSRAGHKSIFSFSYNELLIPPTNNLFEENDLITWFQSDLGGL